jgi:hypothetical protein
VEVVDRVEVVADEMEDKQVQVGGLELWMLRSPSLYSFFLCTCGLV